VYVQCSTKATADACRQALCYTAGVGLGYTAGVGLPAVPGPNVARMNICYGSHKNFNYPS